MPFYSQHIGHIQYGQTATYGQLAADARFMADRLNTADPFTPTHTDIHWWLRTAPPGQLPIVMPFGTTLTPGPHYGWW